MRDLYQNYVDKAQKYFSDFKSILAELVQHPTVAFREPEAIDACAQNLKEIFDKYDYKTTIYPTVPDGSPVVFAEKNIGANKTLLFYHHYDVQPEDPIDLWDSSPWELVERGDRLYARGTSDDKGEIVISLLSIKLLEDLDKLNVNVKFVMEGEEEAGSQNLAFFTEKNQKLLKADGCVWEGATLTPEQDGKISFATPVDLVCGLKGNAYYNIRTMEPPIFPRTDVHSGSAAAVPNAAWSLVWALSSLKNKNEEILIEGFNELVAEPSKEDLKVLEASGNGFEESIKRDYGLKTILLNRTGLDLLVELSLKPSLTICGLDSGFQGEGSKTIVPAKASAKLDFRLVPNLTMKKVDILLRKHLDKHGFDDIEIELIGGYDPAKTPVTDPFIQMLKEISNEITAPKKSIITPIAYGSGPAYLFTEHAPICFIGNYVEGTNGHAPNENIPIRSIASSIAFNAIIAEKMAEKKK